MGNVTRDEVLQFMKEKDKLETELKELSDVLRGQGVGMEEPLVDAEGYPRFDIDVYQVRHARHSIRTKTNDLKEIMKKIESGLTNLHAQAREGVGIEAEMSQAMDLEDKLGGSQASLAPFARVLVVCSGSPAEEAGIKQGDLITKFGSVESSNFTSLKSISDVVEHSRGKPVTVCLTRDGDRLKVELTPKSWSGQGLLGFKIRPVSIQPDR